MAILRLTRSSTNGALRPLQQPRVGWDGIIRQLHGAMARLRLVDQQRQQRGKADGLRRRLPQIKPEGAGAGVGLVEPDLARRLVAEEINTRRAGTADRLERGDRPAPQ